MELLETADGLKARGIHLISLEERRDTSSAAGELVFHVFGSIAHFERRLISERTRDGIAAARKRRRTAGRPPLRNSSRADCHPLEPQNSSALAGQRLTESQRRCVEVETEVLRSLRVISGTNLAMTTIQSAWPLDWSSKSMEIWVLKIMQDVTSHDKGIGEIEIGRMI